MTLRPLRRPPARQPRGATTDPEILLDLEIVRQDTLKINALQEEILGVVEHRRQAWIRLRDKNVSLRRIAAISDTSAQTILNSTSSD